MPATRRMRMNPTGPVSVSVNAATAISARGTSLMKFCPSRSIATGDQGADRGLQSVEDVVELPARSSFTYATESPSIRMNPGSMKPSPAKHPPVRSAADAPEVDAEFVRFRTGKDLVHRKGLLEGLGRDPALLARRIPHGSSRSARPARPTRAARTSGSRGRSRGVDRRRPTETDRLRWAPRGRSRRGTVCVACGRP